MKYRPFIVIVLIFTIFSIYYQLQDLNLNEKDLKTSTRQKLNYLTKQHLLVTQNSDYMQKNTKIVMCVPPKTGTSNWQKLMFAMSNNLTISTIPKGIKNLYLRFPSVANLNDTNLEQSIQTGDPKIFKFMNLRHPLSRLYSCWKDKFTIANGVSVKPYWKQYFSIIRGYERTEKRHPNETVSFASFIKFVGDKGNKMLKDPHWIPIYEL